MALRFGPARALAVAFGAPKPRLAMIERDQLRVAGKRYDGRDLTSGRRLAPVGDGALADIVRWRLVDGGRHRFDAWLYAANSGTVFRVGTTEVVAEIIEGGLQCGDAELRLELGRAMVAANLLPVTDRSYGEFAAAEASATGPQ